MNARGERGFALLLVLWSMAMIALIGARVTASGGGEARIARVALDRALLEQAADGAVHDAMFHLAGGTWTWRTAPAEIGIGRVAVALRLADEGGRVNLNQAPRGLIEALLLAVGLPADRAATLADAIAAWRSAGDRADARPCDASFAITLLPEGSPPHQPAHWETMQNWLRAIPISVPAVSHPRQSTVLSLRISEGSIISGSASDAPVPSAWRC